MSIKTMQLGVSKNLLTKVPRYFGAPNAILRELFQNSFRAGAKNVTITYKENILRFEDDGCGSDAQSLLTAGQSGWEEGSPAVDPAGLGAFSFLRPEYVKSVTYRSRDWQMSLTPANLETRDVDVEYDLEHAPGMRVELTLAEKTQFDEDDFRQARGLYPMNVSYCGAKAEPKEMKPEQLLDYKPVLDVPGAGRVGFGRYGSGHYRRVAARVVWQHAFFNSLALQNALAQGIARLKSAAEQDLAQAIFENLETVFFVDPESGIRPKLPDREEVIDDGHLHAAAYQIVRTVLDEYLAGFDMDQVKALPNVMEKEQKPSAFQRLQTCAKEDTLAANLRRDPVSEETLRFFGYIKVHWCNSSDVWISTQDDGDGRYPAVESESFSGRDILYVREPVIVVEDEGMRAALCEQDIYAVGAARKSGLDKTERDVQVSGLHYQAGDWLAFVDELLVNGKPVEFLARSNSNTLWNCPELDAIDQEKEGRLSAEEKTRYEEEDDELVLVLAVPPAEFLSGLEKRYPFWRGYMAWRFDDQGIVDHITKRSYDDYDFDDALIEARFQQEAIQWLDEKMVGSLGAQELMEEALEHLRRARQDIYLRISGPFWNEWAAKVTVKLVRTAVDWSVHILEARSRAITKKFNATVEKHS